MRKSAKTALGGIVAALSLVLMLLSSVFPNLSLVLPAIAGVVLMIMVIEIGRKWAFTAYIVISILSIFILPDKETAMMFVGFFGYYPVLKSIIEQKLNRVVGFILKFLIFNAAVAVVYLTIIYVFKIPVDFEFHVDFLKGLEKYSIPILLAIANVTFLLYDFLLSRYVVLYLYRLRKYVRRVFK